MKEGIDLELKEKVKNLPTSPGVYLMKDSVGSIIYVGKSKCLKKRVQSYFQKSKAHSSKIEKLVKNLKDFDFIITDTEFEAFMLECKYIKEIKPRYNSLMKSPLSYSYIVVQDNGFYRSIKVVNELLGNQISYCFGPYTSKNIVERALQGIKEHCKILCDNPSRKTTSCLNYSIGLCIGMCLNENTAIQYNSIINRIISLLNGDDRSLLKEMEKKMLSASEIFDFETAAKYRDYIDAVTSLLSKEKVIEFTEENNNIIMAEKLYDKTIKLFFIKRNRILFSEKYNLQDLNSGQLIELIKNLTFAHFKMAAPHSSLEVNKDEIDEAQIIYSYLKCNNCSFIIIPDDCIKNEDNAVVSIFLSKLINSGELAALLEKS